MRWLVVIALLGGCGSLVDDEYAGEPLLRLRGMPRSAPLAMGSSSFGAALRWQGIEPDAAAITRTPLEAEFPAFWIDVVAWPSAHALLRLGDEPGFAEGYLHIVRSDLGAQVGAGDILATELSHVLVYVSSQVAPGSQTADYLGAAFAPGFHVATRAATTALSPAQQQLVEQCVAAAPGVPLDRARATCTAQHLYQLAPAPDDLETLLSFTVLDP